jgi:hypothetical protein
VGHLQAAIRRIAMPLKHQLVNRLPFAYNMYLRMREPFQAHIFSKIYRTNRWADPESVSGAGSSLQVTHVVREELPRILKRLGAASPAGRGLRGSPVDEPRPSGQLQIYGMRHRAETH